MPPKKFIIFWRDDTVPGSGITTNSDNEIISALSFIKTTSGDREIRHEEHHSDGTEGHSNLESSILNTSGTLPTTYQTIDFNTGRILYSRPPGNKSVNGIPDANPDSYQIR